MNIRCKMRLVSKADTAHWDMSKPGKGCSVVKLIAVTDPANKCWSEHTPAGSIELSITNPAAVDALELGACYYVDFTKAPTRAADEPPVPAQD